MHSERSTRVVDDAATDRPEERAARARTRTVASRVDGLKVLADALGQLPVTVRFWDGSTVVARDDPTRRSCSYATSGRSRTSCARPTSSGSAAPGCRARWTSTAISSACSACASASAASRSGASIARGWRPLPCAWPGPARCGGRRSRRCEAAAGRAAALAAPRPGVGAPSLRRLEPLLRAAARAEPGLLVRVLRGRRRLARDARRSASSS